MWATSVMYDEPRSWHFMADKPWNASGDGRTFMSLYPPNIRREDEDYYVLLIDREKIHGRIEFHAGSHEEAKARALILARKYLVRIQEEALEILNDLPI
jgi:hypothetical protein